MPHALLSVFDKTGIVEFGQALVKRGWTLIASGGTAKKLMEAGLKVIDVAEFVGGEAILGHKVVTLSRELHGALLADNSDMEVTELEKLGVPRIDLVYVNMYPLHDEIANPNHTVESVIEKTDIGGPTMLRSAAKGGRITICDPADILDVLQFLDLGDEGSNMYLGYLRAKAEYVVSEYCLASAGFHGKGLYAGLVGTQVATCRYGENPQQTNAGLYAVRGDDPLALHRFEVIEGEPGFVNWTDVDRLLETLVRLKATVDFSDAVVAVAGKHGNACGVGLADNTTELALQRMINGDPRAIFGGVVITNFPIGEREAEQLAYYGGETVDGKRLKRLLDVVVAPAISPEAQSLLSRKGGACKMLVNPALGEINRDSMVKVPQMRPVRGGFLLQDPNSFVFKRDYEGIEFVGNLNPDSILDLQIASAVCDTSNSNTITLVKGGMLIGNGVGQQDRVSAAELAIKRAWDARHGMFGAVAASDSFFPFPDGLEVLAKAGITTVLSRSGSVNDDKVKETAKWLGITLILVPNATSRGFCRH